MFWPKITKNHVDTLCAPFSSENSKNLKEKTNFAGFVYFDVGSVLLDLGWDVYFENLIHICPPSAQFSVDNFKEISLQAKLNSIWSQGKISTMDYAEILKKYIHQSCVNPCDKNISINELKLYDSMIVGAPRPSVLKMVEKLKKQNFAVGLLSNTTPWHANLIHEKVLALQNFDVLIYSNDVGIEKPDLKIYEVSENEAINFVKNKYALDLKKQDIYFVDDTPANVEMATKFGWNARLVNLVKDEILDKIKHNELSDEDLQQASQKRENLLFAIQASERVEALFGNLIG